MTQSPLVSIIIPTYNRATDLKRALDSVLSQNYQEWEAIIIDNHSTDNTDEIVKNFNDQRIQLHKIHNNGVIAASRNLGLSKATGEYVALLDSDDWWTNDKLEKSVILLKGGYDFIYHPMYLVKDGHKLKWLKKTRCRQIADNSFRDLLQHGNTINNSSAVFKKHLLKEAGKLSIEKDLIAIEDYDLWLRIAKTGARFKLISESLGYYWIGGGNISNDYRTLQTTIAISLRYQKEFQELELQKVYNWIYFAKAKSYFKLRNFTLAIETLKKVNYKESDLRSNIKCRFILFISYIKKALS